MRGADSTRGIGACQCCARPCPQLPLGPPTMTGSLSLLARVRVAGEMAVRTGLLPRASRRGHVPRSRQEEKRIKSVSGLAVRRGDLGLLAPAWRVSQARSFFFLLPLSC